MFKKKYLMTSSPFDARPPATDSRLLIAANLGKLNCRRDNKRKIPELNGYADGIK